jgi:CxxC-x17-CxxC domain-containing protein
MGKFNREDRGFSAGGGSGFARGGGGRKFGGKPASFRAVCAACGEDCQVPFKPVDGRPVYCSFCFDEQQGGGHFEKRERPRFDDRRDRQMHDAICDACGASCQVPFRPTGEKEIFCDTCFAVKKKDFAPKKSKDSGETLAQLKMLNEKIDKLLEILAPVKIEKTEKEEKEVKEKKETKAKTSVKKAPAKKKK